MSGETSNAGEEIGRRGRAADEGDTEPHRVDDGQTDRDREPLHVEELHVRRAPGFDAEVLDVEGLSPGITVVHGPNASGKTTVSRAIQWLLWPDAAPSQTELTGQFALDGQDWRVRVDRGRASYQRDGQEVGAPGLPPAEQRDRYRIALHDLLQHDVRDEDFAAAIERESAGGYDLDAAHDALGFDDSPGTRGLKVVGRADDAVEAWRDAQADVREIEADQSRLPELERELEAAADARQRVDLLDQAIDYAQARDELADAEAAVDEFPERLERVDGDELATVQELDAEIETCMETRAAAEADLAAARQQLAAVELPESGLPDGRLDGLRQRVDRLDTYEEREQQFRANLERAEQERAEALQNAPLDVEEAALVDLDPDAWSELSAFARTAEAVAADRQLQRTVERWLGADERPETDRDTLERGQRALEQWLASARADDGGGAAAATRIGAVAAACLTVLGIALGAIVHPALFAVVLVGVGLLAYGLGAGDDAVDDPRATYRERFEQLGLEGPGTWTEDGVRERLLECYDDLAALEIDRQRANKRETLLDEFQELDARENELETRRERLRTHLGAAPEATDVELVATADALGRWQACDEAVQGLQREVEAVERAIDAELDAIAAAVEPYGAVAPDAGVAPDADVTSDADGTPDADLTPHASGSIEDAASATERVRALEDRASRHADALGQRERSRSKIDEADEELAELRAERDAVFTDVGLEPGERERLGDLCEQVEDFEAAVTDRSEKRAVAGKERSDLREMPGYSVDLEDAAVAELRARKRDAEETAEQYDELQQAKTEIETTVTEAKDDARVETARADVDRALDDLEERLEADAAAMVGDVLVEHLRDATIEANRPAVFERARELLARITRGRYRLDLADDGAAFRAYDATKDRGFALTELSSGTQLQVLLAVRVAFVDRHERGVRLPLLLDETLANSDDEKARVIVDATIELARDGRQVLYFTAQGDEVAKWRAALADADDVEWTEIDLAALRELDGRVQVPDLGETALQTPSAPDPAGHDHASYGEVIDVPPFDPRLGAARAHCWYLVEDPAQLARLLDLGVERWGQVRTLLDHGTADLLAEDPAAREELRRAGLALETFVEAWQRGRGERVARDALEATGAVTDTFIDDVTELAREVDGDAERVLERLRGGDVDRFRSGKIDELREYFEDEGYLEPVDPVPPEQIRLRVIATLVERGLDRDDAVEQADALLSRLDRSGDD